MPDILYTSSNVADSNVTLVTNVLPNYTYSITTGSFTLEHMRNASNPSGLVYTSNVTNNAGFSFTAPSDNVSAYFELVRVGTSTSDTQVTVNYSDFNNEHYNYIYSFHAKAYRDYNRTSQLSSVISPTTITKGSYGTLTLNNVSNLTTANVYYQINTFRNETIESSVYANVVEKNANNPLSFNVYDVRGLAYMRQYPTDTGFVEKENISGYNNPTGQGMVLLSADGNRMVSIQEKTNSTVQITSHKWNAASSEWVLCATEEISGFPKNHRYAYNGLTGSQISSFSSALLPYGDLFLLSRDNILEVRTFSDLSIRTSIDVLKTIHCVTVSADGKTILVSGNHAYDSYKDYLIGDAGGSAYIYSLNGTTLEQKANLSSGLITNFSTYFYGSDSVISGDGKTALVIGTKFNVRGKGFIWKFNNFNNQWDHMSNIDIPFGERQYTPCSMSHDGKVVVISDSPWLQKTSIFETSDFLNWNETPLNGFSACDCDISGDGKTVLFSLHKTQGDIDFRLCRKNGLNWDTIKEHKFSNRTRDYLYQHCSLSYDGSTMTMIDTVQLDIFTLRLDKNVVITEVYDYFNKYSTFYYYDYEFDYTNILVPDWGSKTSTQLQNDSIGFHAYHDAIRYGYGQWDATSISADGRYVLIGSPSEKKVYLYHTVNEVIEHTFTRTDTYFGLRCAMDDLAVYVAIAAYDKIYFYKRFENTFQEQSNLNHGYGQSIFQFKMSKDGSTVCMTSAIQSTEIKKWTTTDEWVNVTPDTLVGNSRRVSAFDLSYDGKYVAAGQQTSGQAGDFTIFNGSTNEANVTISTATSPEQRFMHSVAITGNLDDNNEFKILVGTCFPETEKLTAANYFVLNYNTSSNSLSGHTVRNSVSDLPAAGRYGRTAAMSYDGNLMLLSGTVENPNNSDFSGSAVIMDSNGNNKNTFEFSGVTSVSKAIPQANSIEYRFDKYGSGCRISSDNKNVLISGGGYAFLYRI